MLHTVTFEDMGFTMVGSPFDLARKRLYRRLSPNFTADEFYCPCCFTDAVRASTELMLALIESQVMNEAFILKLQYARDVAGIPFNINSGWRCIKHNADVGGTEDSSHPLGEASDIEAITSRQRGLILPSLYKAGFTRIGIRRGFIHVDNSISKDQNVAWLY